MYTLLVCWIDSPLENNFLLDITLYRASMIRNQLPKFQLNVNSPHISLNINEITELSSPTTEICNSLSLSSQKKVMPDCLPRASESSLRMICNEPLLIEFHLRLLWSREERAKPKTVHKVRNKDLVLPFSREDREFFFLFLFGRHFWESFIIMTLKLLSHWKQL